MTGSKGITAILVVAVLIILGVLFIQQRSSDTPTAQAPASDTQPADTTPASDSAPEPAPVPSATPEPTVETQPQADTPAQLQVDTQNWLCSAWQDGTGAIITTGTPNNDTCTQWTIKRGGETE